MFYRLLALCLSLGCLATVQALTAPVYEINTLAGTGKSGLAGDGGAGLTAQFDSPTGVAVDSQGNLYIADKFNHRLRKLAPDGNISTFAGIGTAGYSGDGGQASQAQLNAPLDVAVDAQDQVYVVDSGNHSIRQIDTKGVIRTFAGQGKEGSVNDGKAATTAYLRRPSGIGIDAQGTVYIADSGNHRVRKVDSQGLMQLVAGADRNGGFSGDGGAALAANLKNPLDVAVDSQGNLYIADTDNQRIRKIDKAGKISTLAGGATFGFTADGSEASRALLYNPSSVAIDGKNRLLIADSHNHRIRMIDTNGMIHTIAGSGFNEIGNGGFYGDGVLAGRARLFNPQGLAVDAQGQVLIADTNNQRVRKLKPTGDVALIESVVGARAVGLQGGGFSGDGGVAKEARLQQVQGVAFDAQGNLYIADTGNHRIRKVTPDGTINTIIGSGKQGSSLGSSALTAQLNLPSDVIASANSAQDADTSGNLYIADTGNHRVLKLDAQGTISVFAGTGQKGASGDGSAATKAQLSNPMGLALSADNSLYIADSGNQRVRKVDSQGVITTVAGNGKTGSSGDGAPATQARLKMPVAVALDASGNLYIADRKNYRIRKVDTQGNINTVAGTGQAGYDNDGAALQVRIDEPNGLAFDLQGSLHFSERSTDRLRKLTTDGQIITVAGTGGLGYSGDGDPAITAQMYAPTGIAVDPRSGDLFIADTLNHRVRRVFEAKTQPTLQPPTNSAQADPPALEQALPVLTSRRDCAGVEQAASLDLSTTLNDSSIAEQINALPAFANSQLQPRQDTQRGYLLLEQNALRLSVQPLIARYSTQPLTKPNDALQLGQQQETLLRLTQNDGKVLDIFAQPAVQDLCALQKHTASLGYPNIRVNGDGNLRIHAADSRSSWLSLRPDWIATAIQQEIPDSLLLSGTLFPNHYPSLSLVFTDSDGHKRQQFFYTAPADLAALQAAVQELNIQAFAPWRFSWQGNTYQGVWHQQVQTGAAAAFAIETVADMNGDGTADYRVTYPQGEQQLLFAIPQ